ncbi:MAG TPA: hypothetical protein VM409_02670 [Chloroflexia bacterium]|nr:hypothetical protein [Chloroflexia bacterium]
MYDRYPAYAQQSGWSKLGGLPSGTRIAALDPSNPSVVYVLGPDGISRSTDNAATWSVCNREARWMRVVAPLAPGETTLIYATTPSGLRESTDGCLTWKDTPAQGILPSGAHIRWLAPYPNNHAVLYAGMDGLGGLYRSTDRGASWQAASNGLPAGGYVTAFAADPAQPEQVLVGLRMVRNTYSPAPVYRSTDGGLTWRSSSLGILMLPNNGGYVSGLDWVGNTLFASTPADGLFASGDRGKTWKRANLPRPTGDRARTPDLDQTLQRPLRISAAAASPDGVLIISTPEGAFQSLDAAQTWRSFGPGGDPASTSLLALDASSGRVLLGSREGSWSNVLPRGAVSLPTATAVTVAQVVPTPPAAPQLPTSTPVPPTATQTALPTPTIAIATGPLPTDRVTALDPATSDFFEETGHNIRTGFRDYWKENGGLRLLGYPLTEEFVENGVSVQYFERVRLEYRNKKITWGLLGTELSQGLFFRPVKFFPSEDNNVYFGPTQHSVSGPFLEFWRDNGGLETFGYPLSESFKEEGVEYQWFERARFEWHTDFPEGQKLQLAQLGKISLQKRGWIR